MSDATQLTLMRMTERLARRQEALFLGLPPFVVIRDWMGRPCRLESL